MYPDGVRRKWLMNANREDIMANINERYVHRIDDMGAA